jgi:hypothetical protein
MTESWSKQIRVLSKNNSSFLFYFSSWTPAQFTGSHNAYANSVWYERDFLEKQFKFKNNLNLLFFSFFLQSWTHGTYPVGGDQPYHTVDRNKVLPYYQWYVKIISFRHPTIAPR